MRTLLVGVDAACEGVLSPLFADGELPTLRALFETGASGPLTSQIPPWTASAWPSLYTGTNPGKHGVFDFLAFEGYDWSVVDATHVHRPTVWELADQRGLSSVVVNVPVTHPPRPFDGALIPGYTAPEDPTCHPAGLLEEVREAIGEYRVYPSHQGRADPPPAAQRAEFVSLVEMRGRAFAYLADRFDPDFGFVQFQSTDTLFHDLPGDDRTARAVYRAVDAAVADLLETCDPDTVVLASDHGIGPYDGVEFRVNEFLREAGDVEPVKGGAGMPTWATVRDTQLAAGDDGTAASPRPARAVAERALAIAASVGLTSQRIDRALERLGLAGVARRHVPAGLASAGSEQVDFPASRAYMRSRIECGIRLNLAGREPEGVVPADEYDAVREELIEALAGVTTPEGEPVFDAVGPREAYFEGPHAERAVDIVTVPTDFEHFLSARLSGAVFGEPTEPWNHKREGVIAIRGAGVDPTRALGEAHLFDVAPTVLASLGCPPAPWMDGTALAPVVGAADWAVAGGDEAGTDPDGPYDDTRVGVVEGRDSDVESAERMEDRLADLGYIE